MDLGQREFLFADIQDYGQIGVKHWPTRMAVKQPAHGYDGTSSEC